MAIRDIVTRGFGNGTYSPGVAKVPTRGYAIGVATAPAIGHTVYIIIGAETRPYTIAGAETRPRVVFGAPVKPHNALG